MHATARIASVFFGAALTLGLLAGVTPAQADGSHGDSDRHHRAGAEVDTSDWPQGKSLSNPDGGDLDKPGGTAGTVGDQDGNNGCGNDEDRDDDNNGNCERQDQAAEAQACHVKDKARHDDEADDDVRAHHQSKAKHASEAGDVDDADDESDCPESDDTESDDTESDDTATAAGSVTGTATRVEAAASAAPVSGSAPAATVAGAVEVAGTDATTPDPAGTQVLGITETAPDNLARTGAGLAGLVLAAGACLGGGRLTSLVRRLVGS